MKRLLPIFFFILFLPSIAYSAITHVNTSSGSFSGTTATLAHTLGAGSNRMLIVTIRSSAGFASSADVLSVVYNSVAMTKAKDLGVGSSGNFLNTEIWYMLEASLPASGNVVVTFGSSASNVRVGAMTLAGVKQQAPEATASKDCSGATSCSTNITTLTNDAWIIDIMGIINNHTQTTGAGQTERWNLNFAATSTKPLATAAATTMSWSFTNFGSPASQSRASHCIAVFAPFITSVNVSPSSITSGEAFGTLSISTFSGNLISLTAIESAESFGTLSFAEQVGLISIASGERVPHLFVHTVLTPDPAPVTPTLIFE